MLAGCGNAAQSPLAPPASFQQRSVAPSRLGQLPVQADRRMSGAAKAGLMAMHLHRGHSWMAPGVTKQDLLYVSNINAGSVAVYSYPEGKLVGTLTGFHQPDGLCSDKKGDVWIVNSENSHSGEDIVEYKHGGKTPIATLDDYGQDLVGCSVDPTTGDLAVTNIVSYSNAQGSVAIYTHAKGTPKLYTDPQMFAVYFCGYDDKGNLYVDGTQVVQSGVFQFAELPKGKTKFTNIALKGATIHFPGNVRWDGKYMAVGDQEYTQLSSGNDESAIYQTTGAGGKIVGKTVLKGSGDIIGFSIEGKTVIGPDVQWKGEGNAFIWNYPAGGKPIKTLKGFDGPYGSAVSLAQ